MKTLISLAVMALLVIAAAGLTGNAALAANGAESRLAGTQECRGNVALGAKVRALPASRGYCAEIDTLASMSYPPVFAVSCGSDEWCCKHDIGGTGACTKCCPK